jgi:hypothetical protein
MPPQRRDQPASSAVSISLGQELTTFVAGVVPGSILELPADGYAGAEVGAVPEKLLSTRLPAALRRVSLALRERQSDRLNYAGELRQQAAGPVRDRQGDRQR